MDALGNNGNASVPEQFGRPNPWRRRMMTMMFPIGRRVLFERRLAFTCLRYLHSETHFKIKLRFASCTPLVTRF
jgi:hypothetical protein